LAFRLVFHITPPPDSPSPFHASPLKGEVKRKERYHRAR
jgi:hypothetical protein